MSEGRPGLSNFFVMRPAPRCSAQPPSRSWQTTVDVVQGSPQAEPQRPARCAAAGAGRRTRGEGAIVDADDPSAVEIADQATVPIARRPARSPSSSFGTNAAPQRRTGQAR